MSLVVDKIKCIEETDGPGSDEIYLVVFQGRTVAPFGSSLNAVGPGSVWDDFDSGETANTDVTVSTSHADAVYAVMMAEQDFAKDVAGNDVLGAWRAQTDLIWKSIMLGLVAGGLSTGSTAAKNAAFAGMKNALNGLSALFMAFPKGNDDVIDVKRVTAVTTGSSQVVRFRSEEEDATYDVTFKQTVNA